MQKILKNVNILSFDCTEISEERRPNLRACAALSEFTDAHVLCESDDVSSNPPLRIACHRAIIWSRCPAMHALYEEATKSYVIDSIFRAVIEPFVQFLYTDRVCWAPEVRAYLCLSSTFYVILLSILIYLFAIHSHFAIHIHTYLHHFAIHIHPYFASLCHPCTSIFASLLMRETRKGYSCTHIKWCFVIFLLLTT